MQRQLDVTTAILEDSQAAYEITLRLEAALEASLTICEVDLESRLRPLHGT